MTGKWVSHHGAHLGYVAAGLPDGIGDAEAVQIAKLLERYWARKDALPDRVRRSFWRVEYAARSQHMDVRFLFIVSALESLFKTEIPLRAKCTLLVYPVAELCGPWGRWFDHGRFDGPLLSPD